MIEISENRMMKIISLISKGHTCINEVTIENNVDTVKIPGDEHKVLSSKKAFFYCDSGARIGVYDFDSSKLAGDKVIDEIEDIINNPEYLL